MSNIEQAVADQQATPPNAPAQGDRPRDPETGRYVEQAPEQLEIKPQVEPLKFDDQFAQDVADAFTTPPEQSKQYAAPTSTDAPSPEGEQGDPQGTPSVESAPDPAADPAAPVVDPTAPASEVPPVAPPIAQAPEVVALGDWQLPTSDIPAVRELYEWATGLSPEQHQAVNDVLSGQFYLVPRSAHISPVQGSGGGSAPAPVGADPNLHQPAPAPTPTPSAVDPSEFIDPVAATHIQTLNERFAALENQRMAEMQQMQQAEHARQMQVLDAGLAAAKDSFKAQYNLTDEELSKVIDRTTRMQVIPGLIQQHPGNPTAAFTAGFETAYFADPEFRQREIDRLAQQRAEEARQIELRKNRAASVGAGAAPVARVVPGQTRPMSQEEALAGMERELAEAMHQQGR